MLLWMTRRYRIVFAPPAVLDENSRRSRVLATPSMQPIAHACTCLVQKLPGSGRQD